MRPKQVFIVGMNGSGTTMLLDCLAGHSLLFGFGGETKVLPYFLRNQFRFGDLSIDANFEKLWKELRDEVGGRGWRRGADAAWALGMKASPRCAAGIFDAVMSLLASKEGKYIWCEKTPMYVHHVRLLAEAFPTAKFIHVIRDGRDCAASFHRRWRFNPLRTVYRWKHAVSSGRLQAAGIPDRYLEVRYEQLTLMPESSLRQVCEFLCIPFESELLSQARSRPEMTGSVETSMRPNSRRFDEYFGSVTLTNMENIAGKVLGECGYPLRYTAGDAEPPMWRLRLWEWQDDGRRLWEALRLSGIARRDASMASLSRRVLGALRQKDSLR